MRDCDLIMKGGATSGVVYPFAITQIAETYRLRNIGGTSAGAIAAVIAAAAEYRRQKEGSDAGFEQIKGIASELGVDLATLFQPSPNLAQLFELLKSAVGKEHGPLAALLMAYRGRVFVSVLLMGGLAFLSAVFGGWGFFLFFLLALPILMAVLIGTSLWGLIKTDLPRADFGLCPGKTQPGFSKPAFTDWIADHIDRVAGREITEDTPPLTYGDLQEFGIKVATMTADLSTQRPYQLPLTERRFRVRKSEMERLFAPRIVKHLCPPERARPPKHENDPSDLYELPEEQDFPLVLMARMSLSFPGLISGVPIWRVDYGGKKDAEGHAPMTRLLFSDGGICSNFPVHFFDAALPKWPTFGIKLGPYLPERHGDERVHLPTTAREVSRLRTGEIHSLGAFIMAIFNTAKDWNDTLQSQLTGYAERIVEVRLDAEEGGLNFTMPPEVVEAIQRYGDEAGEQLVHAFADNEHNGFDQHRFVRGVSFASALEEMLMEFNEGYHACPEAGAKSTAEVITDLDTQHFKRISKVERSEVIGPFMDKMASAGADATAAKEDPGRKTILQAGAPAMDAKLKLVADADRRSDANDRVS